MEHGKEARVWVVSAVVLNDMRGHLSDDPKCAWAGGADDPVVR